MNPNGETREDIVPQLKTAIERISTRLADTRDLAVKQTFGLNKFKGKIRDMYVISGLQASLYWLGEFSRDALTSKGNLLSYSCYIQRSISPYVIENQTDFSVQQNIAML